MKQILLTTSYFSILPTKASARYGVQLQVQFQYRDCTHPAQTKLVGATLRGLFWSSSCRHADSVNVHWNSGSSGLSRSPFVNTVNSSISLKLLYNPPYYLSVWSFSKCKMVLISLALYNLFSLKIEFHQFPFLLDCKGHLQWISLKLHQKKFLTYIFDVRKKLTEFRLTFAELNFVTLFWDTRYFLKLWIDFLEQNCISSIVLCSIKWYQMTHFKFIWVEIR